MAAKTINKIAVCQSFKIENLIEVNPQQRDNSVTVLGMYLAKKLGFFSIFIL